MSLPVSMYSINTLKSYIPTQNDDYSYDCIIHMLEVIIDHNFQQKVRDFEQKCGFSWCNDAFVNIIGNHEKII